MIGGNENSQLPKGWIWTTVGEISEKIHYGYTASAVSETVGPRLLRITDIQCDNVDWNKVPYCKIGALEKQKYLLSEGDLVFARTGATVGKSFLIKGKIPEAVFASYLIRIILSKYVRKEFVSNFFKSGMYWQQIKKGQLGIGQPNVNSQTLSRVEIPLAPFNEQERIIGKFEELFARLDAGVEGLRKVKAQLKRYRQAVLKHAIEGKLTEKWRALRVQVEPAELLLQKIKEERTKSSPEYWRNIEPIDPRNLPEIPNSWLWVRAQEVCENITNGYTPPASELHSSSGDIPFIKVNNLTFTGRLDFSKNRTFIDRKMHLTKLKRSMVFPGDVLINIVGPPLGKVSIIPDLYPEWNINQAIVFFRAVKGYDRDFLALCLLSNEVTSHLANQARATAGQFNISVTMCRNLPIPLPPLLEQERIVSEFKKRFDVLEEFEATVDGSVLRAESLRNSVLKDAFEGKLVSQDHSDEPAEKLSERIREEREKSTGEKDINKKKIKPKQLELSTYVK